MRCGDLPRGCQACASERSPELTDLENLRLSYDDLSDKEVYMAALLRHEGRAPGAHLEKILAAPK